MSQVVSDKEYMSWSLQRQRALAAIEQREELVMETAVQLETNLSLLGNTLYTHTHTPFFTVHLCDCKRVSCCRCDRRRGPSAGKRPRHNHSSAGGGDPGVGADW